MKLRSTRSASIILLALIALSISIFVARRNRDLPERCTAGLEAMGARCCAPGQTVIGGACQGSAKRCPASMELQHASPTYCEALTQRVHVEGGRMSQGGSDWETPPAGAETGAVVASFYLDSLEFTVGRYQRCREAQRCRPLQELQADPIAEPGLPLVEITPEDAETLCRAENGRLPRGEEWLFAAAGVEGRRFPWGPSGLVCRRAVFGLVHGPCADGGTSADLSGSREDGRTANGIYDLTGNVAEWTREPSGYAARGGSYRSELAAELKSTAIQMTRDRAPHIGFRCAYDNPPPQNL